MMIVFLALLIIVLGFLLFENIKNRTTKTLIETQQHFLLMAENTFKNFYEQNKLHMDSKEKDIHQILDPIARTLGFLQSQIQVLEKDRLQTSEKLLTQLSEIHNVQKELHFETHHLRKTFHNTGTRGHWGEIQLRRIVEMTGMLEYCDFFEQHTHTEGMRPDMIIRLPEEKYIIIDAKAPMKAYMDSLDKPSEDHVLKVKEHAKNLKAHIKALSQKNYWNQNILTPEFVLLFLPTDAFFSHAFEGDPQLLDFSIQERVIIATPSTLIALLKTIFFVWHNHRISDHAKTVCRIGKELFEHHKELRIHFEKLGKSLDNAVTHFHKTEEHFSKNILPQEKNLKAIMG